MVFRYLRRLSRSAAVLLTCLLLSASMLAASQVSEYSGGVVQETVSENWRGDYDLLVAPQGGLTGAAEETGGLIEQNFAALSAQSNISQAELDQVAQMPGVEVAAPLAFIGQFASPALEVPVGAVVDDWENSEFFEHIRAFTGSISTYYDDGMQLQHLLSSPPNSLFLTGPEQFEIPESVLEAGESDQQDHMVTGWPLMEMFDIDRHQCDECEVDGAESWSEATVEVAGDTAVVYELYEVVPELYTTMVAVDPAEEQTLLGEDGAFLDSLVEFEQVHSAVGDGPCEGEPTDEREHGECLADLVDAERYEHLHEQVFYGNAEGAQSGPVIPIVYSETEYPELFAEAAFQERAVFEGLTRDEVAGDPRFIEAIYEEPSEDPGGELFNITENLVPFIPQLDVSFGLEGAQAPEQPEVAESTQIAADWIPGRVERSQPESGQLPNLPEDVEVALVNEQQGFHALDAELTSREARYRPWERVNPTEKAEPPDGTLLAPVDSYTPGEAVDAESASYVPLGLYAEAESTIVEPGEYEGRSLPPSFSGRGALMNSPGALTTLDAYHSYSEELEVDVIRVRADGVEDYSAENREVIAELAGEIEEIGLDVRVVAGSSLSPVGVYLPEFFDDGTDLGWTVEEWTSLGAAEQAEQAQTTASWMLLGVALTGVTVLACAVQLTGVRPRRAEAALLLSLGWPRGRVRRWFLSEDMPALLLVLGAVASALLLSASAAAQAASAAVGAVFAGVVCLATAAATTDSAVRYRRRRAAGSRAPARDPATIGRRLAWSSPLAMTLSGLSLLVLVSTALTFVIVILSSRSQAGLTRIADLVNAEVLLPQTVLAAGAVTAGAVMFAMGIRRSLRQAVGQHRMLLSAGWSRSELDACIRAQLLTSLLPGAVVAVLAGVAALATAQVSAFGVPVAVVLGVPALGILVALTWSAFHVRGSRVSV